MENGGTIYQGATWSRQSDVRRGRRALSHDYAFATVVVLSERSEVPSGRAV